jgi:uncharacterized protein with PIN domain
MRYHGRVKVVLDTSVIVAATRSDSGASRQLLRAGLARRFEPLLSVALALEYEAVWKRPEQLAVSGGTIEEIDKLLNALPLRYHCIGHFSGVRSCRMPMTTWYWKRR